MSIVTLANEKFFIAELGHTLLDSAKSHGILLEHSCCTGRCGVCKAQVLSGRSEIKLQEQALSEKEVKEGYILTCCRSAIDDIELAVEDLARLANIEVRTLPCRIDALVRLSNDVIEVTLRLPPSSKLDYVAGQHINVIGKHGIRRSYSLANFPREDGKLMLHIRKVPSGIMSEYWFGEAAVNDLLRLEGPLGTFSLRDTQSTQLVFLATGTGIAPVKAMLEELDASPDTAANRQVIVYWGGRKPEDIYWSAKFDYLECEFIPVLSRPGATWQGRLGYVQAALLSEDVDLGDCVVYACGSDDMIHSAREVLVDAGLPSNNFHSDAFVSSD